VHRASGLRFALTNGQIADIGAGRKMFRRVMRPFFAGDGEDSDFVALMRLAVPNMLTTVSATIMSFVDFAFVSQLGSEAQAAVGNAVVLTWSLLGLGTGITGVVTTFASQALGRNEPREGAAYLWQAIWLSAGFGLFCLLLSPLVRYVYANFGHAGKVVMLETQYTQVMFAAAFPILAASALSHYFNGIHRPIVTTISVVAANIFNAVADYALIFGHFGLPAMGVAGAATATLIAAGLRAAFLLGMLALPVFRERFRPFAAMRLNLQRLRNLLRVGGPVSLQTAADIAAWALFANWIIGRFGTVQLAATHIVWKFMELSWLPALGIGSAVNALVGKAIGQGRPDLAQRRTRLGLICCLTYMAAMGLAFLLFRWQLVGLLANEEKVLAWGARLMIIAAAFQLFDPLCIIYSNALRGAGDTKIPSAIVIGYCYGLVIVGGRLISAVWPEGESLGPWLMSAAYVMLLGSTLRLRWNGGSWRRIDLFGQTKPTEPAAACAKVTGCMTGEAVDG